MFLGEHNSFKRMHVSWGNTIVLRANACFLGNTIVLRANASFLGEHNSFASECMFLGERNSFKRMHVSWGTQ